MAVCRSSSASSLFFLRTQCPLKLTSSSSLSNRKPNLWKTYKGEIITQIAKADPTTRGPVMTIVIVIRSHVQYLHKRSFRYLLTTAILHSKNRRGKQETSGMLHLYQFHCRFFKLCFLKQVGHAKRDTRPETVPTCPALPTYN